MDGFFDGLNRVIFVCDYFGNINVKYKMFKVFY